MAEKTELQHVLVLDPDRLCGAMIAQTARRVFPDADVDYESEPAVAAVRLAERPVDFLIVAVRGFDLDILTLLGVWAEHNVQHTRVLVVAPQANCSALLALQTLPINGIFDSTHGDLAELEVACRAIADGQAYWSSTVRARMEKPQAATKVIASPAPLRRAPPERGMAYLRVDMPCERPVNSNIPLWRR
jgi:DNA-binding NarL/FixJ family response regulator